MQRLIDAQAFADISKGYGVWPTALAVDGSTLWIASRAIGRIYEYRDGALQGSVGTGSDSGMEGIAVSHGDVWYADGDYGQIDHWKHLSGPSAVTASAPLLGSVPQTASSPDGTPVGEVTLDLPLGLAVGADGTLYVAEAGTGRIRRLPPGGTIRTVIDGLDVPSAVAVAPDGSLRIAEAGGGRLLSWSAATGLVALATALPSPLGVTVDGVGRTWVADGTAGQVLAITPTGGKQVYRLTGVADPGALAAGDGLYVVDLATHSVWRGALPP